MAFVRRRVACGSGVIGLVSTLGLVLPLAPVTVRGQCIDYGDYLHWVAGIQEGGADICLVGNYAYLCQGAGSLGVIDISNWLDPTFLGAVHCPTASPRCKCGELPGNVAGGGDRACTLSHVICPAIPYCPPSHSALHVFDTTDPDSPQWTGSIEWVQVLARDVAIRGHYAYVVDEVDHLSVIEIHAPTPTIVGSLEGVGTSIVARGDYAYASGGGALRVVDISDPASPVIVASAGEGFGHVAVAGDYAYITSSTLQVIDVTEPTSPFVVGSVGIRACGGKVAVEGDRVFVTAEYGLHYPCPPGVACEVLDVSDPKSPQVVGSLGVTSSWIDGFNGVAAAGAHGFLVSYYGMEVFDASSPESAPAVGRLTTGLVPWDVAVEGNRVVVPGGGPTGLWQLHVIDAGDPASPQHLGAVEVLGARSVAITGEYAHVGTGYGFSGVREIDMSEPTNPQVVGGVDTPAPTLDIAVVNGIAYAAADSLYTIDVSDPTAPHILGRLDTPGSVLRIAVSGGYAYIADGAGLQIVDIADPASPGVVGSVSVSPNESVIAVAVVGQHAYVTSQHAYVTGRPSRLYVIDTVDPTLPQITGSVELPSVSRGVTAVGPYAYVAGGGALYDLSPLRQLAVVDVGDPTSPRVVGSVGPVFGSVASSGDLILVPYVSAYVATESGLAIFPAHCEQPVPVTLSGFAAAVRDRDVLLSWFTSFEGMHHGFNVYRSGLLESDYARLNDRLIRGRSPYSYLDSAVRPATTYYYKLGAVDLDGHEVFHGPISVTTPAWGTRTELRLASPSPFGKETVLQFALAAPGKARLAVYDVAGRLVRVLLNEELPVGDHDATWDGRDDAGLRVAGGTYFVKFTAGDVSHTRKVVYLGGK